MESLSQTLAEVKDRVRPAPIDMHLISGGAVTAFWYRMRLRCIPIDQLGQIKQEQSH